MIAEDQLVGLSAADGKEFNLDPNFEHSFQNDANTFQYSDGNGGWVDYPQSAPGQRAFIAYPPADGRVRLNGGAAIISIKRLPAQR